MSNIFQAEFWKSLYFRAMGGQETAADPNAMFGSFAGGAAYQAGLTGLATMAGTFAGSSAYEGALTGPAPTGNELAGTFAGSASFTGTLIPQAQVVEAFDTHDGRKRQPEYDQDTLIALARAEDEADKARREKDRKSKFDLRRILGRVLGEPEPEAPEPIALPVAIVLAPEPEPFTMDADEAAALLAKQKEDDDAIIILLLAA
jgi:homoserine acetyltransferase